MFCPYCEWALMEVERWDRKLWVHGFQCDVNDEGKIVVAGPMPPEYCPYRGKYLNPGGELFMPPNGYPGGAATVVRGVDESGELKVIGRPGDINT